MNDFMMKLIEHGVEMRLHPSETKNMIRVGFYKTGKNELKFRQEFWMGVGDNDIGFSFCLDLWVREKNMLFYEEKENMCPFYHCLWTHTPHLSPLYIFSLYERRAYEDKKVRTRFSV